MLTRAIGRINVIPSILLEVVKTRAEGKMHSFYPTPSAAENMDTQHSQCTLHACLLFADLGKAYDRVEREMSVGCRCAEADFASQLQCLGLGGDDLQWCLDFLCSDGSVMQEAGLEIELVDIVGLPSDQTSVVEKQCGGAKVVPSVALSFRCCTRKPHVRLPAVHAVKTCSSHFLLTPSERHGHALPTPWHLMWKSSMWSMSTTQYGLSARKGLQNSMKNLTVCSRWLRLVSTSTAYL